MAKKSTKQKKKELNAKGKDVSLYGLVFKTIYTEKQRELINKSCGCAFLVANLYKDWKDKYYEQYKKSISANEFKFFLANIIKPSEEYKFLNEVDKFALETAVENMDNGYKNFFEGRSKYPKYKNKHKDKRCYTTKFTNNNIELIKENNKLYLKLPKLGKLELISYKNNKIKKILKGSIKIKRVTVTMKNRDIFVSLTLEEEIDLVTPITEIDKKQITAGDLGIKSLLDLYNGEEHIKIDNYKYLNQSLDKLKKEQRKLSRMTIGSHNYNKQKEKVNKIYFHIANQRKDYLHKISRMIVNENQDYISEDLSITNMVKNKRLSRQILDCGWGTLDTFIKYKIEEKGGYFIKVDKFYPSSKTCSCCGYKKIDLNLNIREWDCPQCKAHLDRDSNASENLRNEGIKILSSMGLAIN